jgi:hypothetical protein
MTRGEDGYRAVRLPSPVPQGDRHEDSACAESQEHGKEQNDVRPTPESTQDQKGQDQG